MPPRVGPSLTKLIAIALVTTATIDAHLGSSHGVSTVVAGVSANDIAAHPSPC